MELIRYSPDGPARHEPCAATIGNFDGVHLGHQSVIRQLRHCADESDLPAVVITFEPQPREHFSPAAAPARLTTLRDKIEILGELGIDKVCCLRFNESLAGLSARAFAGDLLAGALGVKHLIIGDDFRFGKDRAGDYEQLRTWSGEFGFAVTPTATFALHGARVGSGRIRDAIAAGRFDEATALLGRPFAISGRVVHGDKRGRSLGYPTANLNLRRRRSPVHGVYAVQVHGIDGGTRRGVASAGTRPVFGGDRFLLEVYLLDFGGEIYGQRIRIEFLNRVRAEENFEHVEALRARMDEDVAQVQAYFQNAVN